MMGFEMRWAQTVFEGYAPPVDESRGLSPKDGEVDWAERYQRSLKVSGPKAEMGARLAVAFVYFLPLFLGHFRTMGGLSRERRALVLERLLSSSLFVVRELTLLTKINACLAMMGTASVVERSNYYRGRAQLMPEALDQSGERRRLPVMSKSVPPSDMENGDANDSGDSSAVEGVAQ